MPRTCNVCVHQERDSIDKAIVAGEPYRSIARRFSISKDSVSRHAQNHLSESLKSAYTDKGKALGEELLNRVEGLISKAEDLLAYGERKPKGPHWASGLREFRKSLELLARLTGELDDRPQINLIASEEWVELRAVILTVLKPHPEILKELTEAFREAGY